MSLHQVSNGQFLTLDQGLFQLLSPTTAQLDVCRVVALFLFPVTPATRPKTVALAGNAKQIEHQDKGDQTGGCGDEFQRRKRAGDGQADDDDSDAEADDQTRAFPQP